ncbi:alpha/beta hydrolase fold [Anaeromyxobacter sp. K]|uniref:alpha/beta fold hydrolase n=1 Tax=Anaeromyxobacter sp. (strain K) TaxID=447217 RepID=UPI00015F8958|nr:alpha/beta hydrolase [Anaeromyxobacter sp. K]ACG72851.1 alpha/beta hydrolase fold [Anaeromyxobacter sp. K]
MTALLPAALAAALLAASPAAPNAPARAPAGPVQRGHAPVNGLRIYYEIHGPAGAKGPPLVLLHGGGSSIDTSFASLLPALARHRRVIAFDQQGHGRTADLPDRPFTFEQSADDAAALLRHLGVARADLLGFSNGGTIALRVAVRHPALVRRLVVASTLVRRDGLAPQAWEAIRRGRLEDMPVELRQAYLAVAPHPDQLASFHAKSARRMLEFRDWPDAEVRSITVPVLVVAGDRDAVLPEHAVALTRMLPDARLAVLPATDHDGVVRRRVEWLGPMIEAFLDEP